jgi:spermidine/putrescine-binding protein
VLKRGGAARIGLIVAALAVAGCLRSSPEVVVYTSEDQVFSEPVLKDFEKTSGIKVRAVYDTEETKSTGVALRIVAERDRPQADVFWANEPLRTVMLQQEGLLEAYRSPSAEGIPARYRDPDDHWTGFAARARVILYNTEEVKAGEAPSSVRDLVDPRWKGRAGLANPLFGTTTTQVAALVALWGEPAAKKFLDEVKANGVKLVTSNGEAKDLLHSISPTVEHAARLAGVPWITMVRRVLLPSLAPALAGVWGLTFILCLRDLDLAMTVHPPGVETLPIRVYTLMANSSSSVTAGLALLMVALTLAVMLVAGAAVAAARRASAWN